MGPGSCSELVQRMITNPIQGPRSTAEPRSVFPAIGELASSSAMAEEEEGVTATACCAGFLVVDAECPFAPLPYRVDNCHLLSRQRKMERSSHIGPGIALVR